MNDRSYIALSILAGAVVGGVAGFLFLTDRGRQLRADIQPHLGDLVAEARKLRDMVGRVKDTVSEGWRPAEEFAADLGEQSPPWPGAADARSH